jgi:hypothetical protein
MSRGTTSFGFGIPRVGAVRAIFDRCGLIRGAWSFRVLLGLGRTHWIGAGYTYGRTFWIGRKVIDPTRDLYTERPFCVRFTRNGNAVGYIRH